MAIQYLGTTISGVSGDTKPTLTANEKGVIFVETDTNKIYQWDTDSWNLTTADDATTSAKGVASFSSDNFAVSSGAVTIKDGGVILGTETTGNYVQTVAGDNNEIVVSGSTGAVTIGIVDNPTLPGNVTVSGNLTVSGSTTTVDTATLAVEDPLVSLATGNNSSDAVDIGIYGLYDTSGSQDLYGGLFRDANDSGKWKLFKDLQAAPTTTVNVSGTGYATGTLVANLEGNITGTAPAGTLTGNTLASGVTASSLTSVGTLTDLTVSGTSTTIGTVTSGIWNAGAVTSSGTITGITLDISDNATIGDTTDTADRTLTISSDDGYASAVIFGNNGDADRAWWKYYGGDDSPADQMELKVTGSSHSRYQVASNVATVAFQASSGAKLSTTSGDMTIEVAGNNVVVKGTGSAASFLDLDSVSGQNSRLRFFNGGTAKWNIGNDAGASDSFNIYNQAASANALQISAANVLTFSGQIKYSGTTGSGVWIDRTNSANAYLRLSNTTDSNGYLGYEGTNMVFNTENSTRMTLNDTNLTLGDGLSVDGYNDAATRDNVRFKSQRTTGNATYLRIGRYGTGDDGTMFIGNNYNRNSGFAADNTSVGVSSIKFNTDGSLNFQTAAAGTAQPTDKLTISAAGLTTMSGGFSSTGAGYLGADGAGIDVTFYGTTAGRFIKWAGASGNNLLFSDNAKAYFGQPGNDLQIYHNGTNSYIHDAGDGALIVKTNIFTLRNAADSEQMIYAGENGSVDLYYDSVKKFETSSTGAIVRGIRNNTVQPSNGMFKMLDTTGGNGIYMGTFDSTNTYASYIQSAYLSDSPDVKYNLILQPDGGNVGIGTSTLTAAAGLAIKKNGDNLYLEQSNADNGWIIQTLDADGKLYFERRGEGGSPSNNARMTITTAGNVGIGVAAPDQKLEVAGAIHISGEVSSPSAPSDGDGAILYAKSDGKLYFISNEEAETEIGGGGGGGYATSYCASLLGIY